MMEQNECEHTRLVTPIFLCHGLKSINAWCQLHLVPFCIQFCKRRMQFKPQVKLVDDVCNTGFDSAWSEKASVCVNNKYGCVIEAAQDWHQAAAGEGHVGCSCWDDT